MDVLLWAFFVGCLACACIVVMALTNDKWALRWAAILTARVEARVAYRERYTAALSRIEADFGLEPRG